MKRFNAFSLAAAVLSAACACGQADAAEMLNQPGYGFGYGGGMGMGYGGMGGYGFGMPGYAPATVAGYPGYGGYGGMGRGWGGRHHGWNHGGFGGYGGCGGGMNTNWDGYCSDCGGAGGCGHVKVRRRCRPLGCGAGPYVDPNCCGQAVEACAPAPCGRHRCRLFHRHRRFAACCVDACCDDCGMDGSVGYDSVDDMSVQSQSDSEELRVPTPAADEKPMPMPPESGT